MGTKQSSPSKPDGGAATSPRNGKPFSKKDGKAEPKSNGVHKGSDVPKSPSRRTPGKANGSPERKSSQKMSPALDANGHGPQLVISSSEANGHANNDRANSFSPTSNFIADKDVQVNLAMADLMAYLQVVADNSNNLPLTRRDDPELSRTVSTLTADDYAKKSAAFIPSDVRVIGGSFTRYGRVWDLPTSEEYNVVDGAQEPGRSYGGACSNALLKVLYDLASEAADDVIHKTMSPGSLFEEDDESLVGAHSMDRTRTFESLVLGDAISPSSITWASLLRKMKVEMQELDYPQAPTVSSTRKFDLNTPFSLIPRNFDPVKGKKRSLLIGCNYYSTNGAQLKASHDDIRSMQDYIINVHGFPEAKGLMTVLLDDAHHKHPTHMNITEAFKALSEESRPGDAVFIMFSGHGGRVFDAPIDDNVESYDETIVPSDFQTSGLIRDTLIFKTLLAPMRSGVTVTMIIDCCDTGMMLDLPYAWSTKTEQMESHAKMSSNEDFSFVRFLKVVKTLYESSVFTQLGKTVGSALNYQPLTSRDDTEVDGTGDDETMDENTLADDQTLKAVPDSTSTFCFGLAQKSSAACNDAAESMLNDGKLDDSGTVDTQDKQRGAGSQSLLEQVMNCTLGHDDDLSDDDTFPVTSYGDASTFDTELDSQTRPRRSSNSRPTRRAHV